jgi:hypothetical protein
MEEKNNTINETSDKSGVDGQDSNLYEEGTPNNEINQKNTQNKGEPSLAKTTTGTIKQISRLVIGLSLLGSEEFSKTLQDAQKKVDENSEFSSTDYVHSEDDELAQMRYLMLGTFSKIQKKATKRAEKGLKFTLRTSGTMLGTFYALTDNPIMRPLRKPVDTVLSEVVRNVDQTLRVGKYEEMQSKALARETTKEVVDGTMEQVADNPKMAKMIQDIVGSQSLGMMKMIMDGVTERTAYYDAVLEGFVRRILHLTPRSELPPSPIAGKPQYMYLPKEYIPDNDNIE